MSRNLGSTTCAICNDRIVLEDSPRPILASECGAHAAEYVGKLAVASAHCGHCGALYLAWVSIRDPKHRGGHLYNERDLPLVDLSFRNSFNDEPDARDLPPVAMLRQIHRRDCVLRAQEVRQEIVRMHVEADAMEREGDGPSHWEAYLSMRIEAPIPGDDLHSAMIALESALARLSDLLARRIAIPAWEILNEAHFLPPIRRGPRTRATTQEERADIARYGVLLLRLLDRMLLPAAGLRRRFATLIDVERAIDAEAVDGISGIHRAVLSWGRAHEQSRMPAGEPRTTASPEDTPGDEATQAREIE